MAAPNKYTPKSLLAALIFTIATFILYIAFLIDADVSTEMLVQTVEELDKEYDDGA